MPDKQHLVWLITGTSSGIGREIAFAGLKRGDYVIATTRARSMTKLEDLRTSGASVLELDVTDSVEHLNEIAAAAVAIHGRIDVVVNNAGYGQIGAVEELTSEESIKLFHTNFFGGLNVARAFLPFMRKAGTGTIVWIGSAYGWGPVAGDGMYCASKAAVRLLSQTLNAEIQHLGLRSINIDLGWFRTEICNPNNAVMYTSRIADYGPVVGPMSDVVIGMHHNQPGDPAKASQIVVDLVRGEGAAEGHKFPSTICLGPDCHSFVTEICEKTSRGLEEWRPVSCSTDL